MRIRSLKMSTDLVHHVARIPRGIIVGVEESLCHLLQGGMRNFVVSIFCLVRMFELGCFIVRHRCHFVVKADLFASAYAALGKKESSFRSPQHVDCHWCCCHVWACCGSHGVPAVVAAAVVAVVVVVVVVVSVVVVLQ